MKKLHEGLTVRTLKAQTERYYNYPKGHNMHSAPLGSIGIIKQAYIPKVRPGPGSDYFATVTINGFEYSYLHSDLKTIK